ncbi:MAG: TonB-dependent receptor [Coleofasciculus sp. G1-WW12-02]|uniref:TonB-dependent receptor plug domain-containing protein n=1 Tax=Coleofasciculus sp. G1-WW12-02 TaxID=3068483 RepID=UPI0032F707CE
MKLNLFAPSLILLSCGIAPIVIAQPDSDSSIIEFNQADTSPNTRGDKGDGDKREKFLSTNATSYNQESVSSLRENTTEASSAQQPNSDIPRLSDIDFPYTSAELLITEPISSTPTLSQTNQPSDIEEQSEIEIIVTDEREVFPESSNPVYVITEEEIQNRGSNSVAEVLRGLPGFAINDFGFGADIHTGTYYRGNSINQSVFLLNGRPIGTNINTYHGATDLNSLPVEAIERVELSSGTSSTLYGSEAFGGVVNIVTKQGQQTPRLDAGFQYGSYEQLNSRISYGGSDGSLRYNFGYEEYEADNHYRVPEGAANRDSEGRLFNGDTATSNYFGNLTLDLNPRNTISLDAYKISSRRGLLYFGFPLQRDRLDHDVFNIGLSGKTLLSGGEDSVLTTTLAYNQDYFNTYGPTQNIYYRTGTLNSQAITARVEHQWQLTPSNKLIWGVDLQNNFLNGDVLSTAPARSNLNETENRDRFHAALFALNTWKLTDAFQIDLGLRQNFNSEFGSNLNPSVGTRWAITPGIAMRGSWVSVQRNPGLDQLYVYDTVHNWLPNPDLDPETGSSWTAGLDVSFSPSLIGQFTYFGSSLSDRIGIQVGRWENIGLVKTNGIEMALRWQMAPEWSTFLNYTYTDAEIKTGSEKGLQLAMVPYSVAQLGIGYASAGWQLNVYASYNSGSRRAFFLNPGESTTEFIPSWLNLDLSARIPVTPNIGLVVYLENLADVRYEKANRIYHPGLTFRIGLQSSF